MDRANEVQYSLSHIGGTETFGDTVLVDLISPFNVCLWQTEPARAGKGPTVWCISSLSRNGVVIHPLDALL
jgi:hypothetical protein